MKNTIISFIFILWVCACSEEKSALISTNNEGGYLFREGSSTDSDSIYIHGKVMDLEDQAPLESSQVILYCDQVLTDENGLFRIKTSKRGLKEFSLKFRFIGYKTLDTRPLPLKDSLEIKVYLEIADQTIYHCE